MSIERILSQSSSLSNNDSVDFTAPNDALKMRLVKEFENSYAIIRKINEITCEIESCQQDTNKLGDFYNLKIAELDRLEIDLKVWRASKKRIRDSLNYLEKQHELILIDQEQRQKEHDSVILNYEKMMTIRKDIFMSRPAIRKKITLVTRLNKCKIELAAIKKQTDDWQLKEYQMKNIQCMRLNTAVVHLAETISVKKSAHLKIQSLLELLGQEKMQLKKLTELKQIQAINLENTIVIQKRTIKNIFKDSGIPRISPNVKQSWKEPKNKMTEPRDLVKCVTTAVSPNADSSVAIQPAKSRLISHRSPVSPNMSQNNSKSSGKSQVTRSSWIGSNLKLGKPTGRSTNCRKFVNAVSMPTTNVIRHKNKSSSESCFNSSNGKFSSITSKYNIFSSGCGLLSQSSSNISNRISRPCRLENGPSSISTKNISEKSPLEFFPSRIPVLKSPHSVESSHVPVHFSPFMKSPGSSTRIQRDVYSTELKKSSRTPEIIFKNSREPLLSTRGSQINSPKNPKRLKETLAMNTSTPRSKDPKLINIAADVDAKVKVLLQDDERGRVTQNSRQFKSINAVSLKDVLQKKLLSLNSTNTSSFSERKVMSPCFLRMPVKEAVVKKKIVPNSTSHKLENNLSSKVISEFDLFSEDQVLKLSDLL